MLEKATKEHQFLKDNPKMREHSYSLAYANKRKKEAQYTTETILTLRWYLVNQLIDDLKNTITPESEDTHQVLEDVRDYLTLTNVFSKNLGRVISRHS